MKKILTFLTILVFVTSCLVMASAQPRRKRNTNINRGVARTGGQPRSAIGAGGAGTYARNRRVDTSRATANASGFRKGVRGGFMKESKTRS